MVRRFPGALTHWRNMEDLAPRTVVPQAADEYGLERCAAHGYQADPESLGDLPEDRGLTP